VAMANRNARLAWALLSTGKAFESEHVQAPMASVLEAVTVNCAGGIERATINRLSHMAPRSQWDELLGVEASTISVSNSAATAWQHCAAGPGTPGC
jgi:hypothetical protein